METIVERSVFEVKIYHSGFCSYRVTAENEDVAILKARKLRVKSSELLTTLENWEEADIAEEVTGQ